MEFRSYSYAELGSPAESGSFQDANGTWIDISPKAFNMWREDMFQRRMKFANTKGIADRDDNWQASGLVD
jgi:hypothetical protein